MEITNKGYINFNEKFNKKKDKFMTASMSFANGKDEKGEWKNDYIQVMVFADNIANLEAHVGQLSEIKGYYRMNEHNGNKYPQVIINEFTDNIQAQESPFSNSNPMDVSDLDLPF